jgi:hypothetical protein
MNELLDHSKRVMHYSFFGWVLCLYMMQRLPDSTSIDPLLYQKPVQETVPQDEFHFRYMDQDIRVRPVASYKLNGLVVSHNDPGKWYNFDITHDSRSLNTRDICVVWGDNLKTDEYMKVHYHNDDWMCSWSYGSGVTRFKESEISNNHLITVSDAVREQIAELQVGDKIQITGQLVYYAEERWGAALRQTSLTREDTGNGACEIIFVESLKVLHSKNWLWAYLRSIFYWIIVATLTLHATMFLAERRPRKRKARTPLNKYRSFKEWSDRGD